MRKWNVVLAGMGLTVAAAAPGIALAETSGAAPVLPVMGKAFGGVRTGMRPGTSVHRWGPRMQGRWYAGWYAPGGWGAYRRPIVGYVLPRYWVGSGFLISNYGAYDLPTPGEGYRWSRYYDDAVMTDRHGRVVDHRGDVDWDGYDTLGDQDAPPPPGGWYDDGVTYGHGQEGRAERMADGRPGVDYDAPPYAPAAPYALPAPYVRREVRDGAVVTTTQGPGYIAGGYYYPAPTVTTVVIQPAVTTTYVKKTVAGVRPKHRAHCRCK